MTIDQLIKKYKIEEFTKKIELDLAKHNGTLILKKPRLNNKSFDGEFSEMEMTISCFVDPTSTYWIGVLAHEYAHFLQCVGKSKLWNDFQEKVFAHIDNLEEMFTNKTKKLSKKIRKKISQHIIRMELDCDKRAVKLITKYKLPVDKKDYSSKANIVLYKYLFWEEYGIWPSVSDSKNKRLDFKLLKISKLMSEEKYKTVDDIPRKIFYLFKDN